MNAKGIIRKISVGDIKEGITYKVGQYMMGGRLLLERIEQDLDCLSMGDTVFHIYVSESNSGVVRLWKSFINMEVVIEYDISIERG